MFYFAGGYLLHLEAQCYVFCPKERNGANRNNLLLECEVEHLRIGQWPFFWPVLAFSYPAQFQKLLGSSATCRRSQQFTIEEPADDCVSFSVSVSVFVPTS
jgi:hypothetical protein